MKLKFDERFYYETIIITDENEKCSLFVVEPSNIFRSAVIAV